MCDDIGTVKNVGTVIAKVFCDLVFIHYRFHIFLSSGTDYFIDWKIFAHCCVRYPAAMSYGYGLLCFAVSGVY